ncbi:MAG: hypothetical protein ORN85_04750, partial [Sediminibacterium sp.]|nr:hypothetical protein [Sediminibacterium sp.]
KNFTKTRIIFINLKFLLDTILFECIEKQQLLPYHHLRTLLLTPYFGSLKVGSYKIDDILLPSN